MTENKPKTALERIENLENGFVGMFSNLENVSSDLMTIKEAIKLLANKVDSMAKLNVSGELMTDDNISRLMISNNEAELKQKVESLKSQGLLQDTDVVAVDSFVSAKEIDQDGNVVNPRLQFLVSSFGEEIKSKLLGTKVGDIVEIEEGKLKLDITEIYSVKSPVAQTQQTTV